MSKEFIKDTFRTEIVCRFFRIHKWGTWIHATAKFKSDVLLRTCLLCAQLEMIEVKEIDLEKSMEENFSDGK